MAYDRMVQVLRWRPSQTTVTLTGTGYAALPASPYRVIDVVGALVQRTDKAQVLTGAYFLATGDKYIDQGSLTIRTATGGGGSLLVENTDYRVDYDGGRIQLLGSNARATYYLTYQYVTATYERSHDLGSSGDYEVDEVESTSQGIRRTAGSTIVSGASVVVKYWYAEEYMRSTLGSNERLISCDYTIASIGSFAKDRATLVIQRPDVDIDLAPPHVELRLFFDQAADFPDTPEAWMRLKALPSHDGVDKLTLEFEGMGQWLYDVYIAPGSPNGIVYNGTLTSQIIDILKDYGPEQVLVRNALIASTSETVNTTIAEESLGDIIDNFALIAASDGNGTWVWNVRADGYLYFKRRPTTDQATVRHGVSNAFVSRKPTTYKPVTKIITVNPNSTRRIFTHQRVFDVDDDLYRYERAVTVRTAGWINENEAAKLAVGMLEEFARNRVTIEALLIDQSTSRVAPDLGNLLLYNGAGLSLGSYPIQSVAVQFDGAYNVTYECGYVDDRSPKRESATNAGGLTPVQAGPVYAPFAARCSGAIASGASGTIVEIDAADSTDLPGGRSVTARNIGPVNAADNDGVLAQVDENGLPFFSRRGGVKSIAVYIDGVLAYRATITTATTLIAQIQYQILVGGGTDMNSFVSGIISTPPALLPLIFNGPNDGGAIGSATTSPPATPFSGAHQSIASASFAYVSNALTVDAFHSTSFNPIPPPFLNRTAQSILHITPGGGLQVTLNAYITGSTNLSVHPLNYYDIQIAPALLPVQTGGAATPIGGENVFLPDSNANPMANPHTIRVVYTL